MSGQIRYSVEFKIDAVAQIIERGFSVKEVAERFGISTKSLYTWNLQLHHVVSDITGMTGMKTIRAVIAGERDLNVLAAFRDVRCKAHVETIKSAFHGMGLSLSLKLVGECGTDLRAWPSAKHLTSWLCLATGNKISGGKVLSSRTRRSSSRAAALLRLAPVTIGRSDTALGAFYRRLAARAGKSKAVTATARKIVALF